MTFLGLAACLTLLAYGAGVSVASPLTLLLLRGAARAPDPDTRSRRLLVVRFLPACVGASVAVGLVLPAFLLHELPDTTERIGWAMGFLAALFASIVVAGLVRGLLAILATNRLVRGWVREGQPIRLPGTALPVFRVPEPFPLVAVAGWLRPRLFVSNAVLEACTGEEIAAIVAHESGHLERKDTWSRLLFRACPDLLAIVPLGADIERRWAEASEQAADDLAAASGELQAMDLASALLRVARLAGSRTARELPLSALHRGGSVAGRVARLLDPRPSFPARIRAAGWPVLLTVSSIGPAAALLGALAPVHRALEVVVSFLAR